MDKNGLGSTADFPALRAGASCEAWGSGTRSVPLRDHESRTDSIGALIVIEQALSIAVEILDVETERIAEAFMDHG